MIPRIPLPGHGYPLIGPTVEALHDLACGEQDTHPPTHQP